MGTLNNQHPLLIQPLIYPDAYGTPQTGKATLGKPFRTRIVLYLGNRVIPFVEKLWLVPVHALWAP